MTDLTTNRNDPRLGHGIDNERVPQNGAYLILSEEERAKGFVRPVRESYRHVGIAGPKNPLRDLTDEEQKRYEGLGYVKFEKYPEDETPKIGRYWTQNELDAVDKGCGHVTTMSRPLAETYAASPHFYGSTYCAFCEMHRPVAEFVWLDGWRVGS